METPLWDPLIVGICWNRLEYVGMDHHWESCFDSWRHHQLPPALPWFQTSSNSLIHPMRHVTQIPNHRSNQCQISIMYGTVSLQVQQRCQTPSLTFPSWEKWETNWILTFFAYTVRKCRITHQSQFMAGIVPQYIGEYDIVSLCIINPQQFLIIMQIFLRYSELFWYVHIFSPIFPYNQPTDRFSPATAIHAASASASPRVVAP